MRKIERGRVDRESRQRKQSKLPLQALGCPASAHKPASGQSFCCLSLLLGTVRQNGKKKSLRSEPKASTNNNCTATTKTIKHRKWWKESESETTKKLDAAICVYVQGTAALSLQGKCSLVPSLHWLRPIARVDCTRRGGGGGCGCELEELAKSASDCQSINRTCI